MPSATTAFRSRLVPGDLDERVGAGGEPERADAARGSTSGRAFRNAIAPSTSFVQPQPHAFWRPSLRPRPRAS